MAYIRPPARALPLTLGQQQPLSLAPRHSFPKSFFYLLDSFDLLSLTRTALSGSTSLLALVVLLSLTWSGNVNDLSERCTPSGMCSSLRCTHCPSPSHCQRDRTRHLSSRVSPVNLDRQLHFGQINMVANE